MANGVPDVLERRLESVMIVRILGQEQHSPVINAMTKSNTGRKGFYFSHHEGKPGQELRAGVWRQDGSASCSTGFLGCLPYTTQDQGRLPGDGTSQSALGSVISITDEENSPQSCHKLI